MLLWIKATPTTMPKNLEPVMATVVGKHGKDIMKDAVWDEAENKWGYVDTYDDEEYIAYLEEDFVVTHWMPYPAPADD